MLSSKHIIAGAALSLLAVACGGGNATSKAPTVTGAPPGTPGVQVSKEAANKFNTAMDAFIARERAADWSDASCADVAKQFEAAAAEQQGNNLPEAHFNAGLAYQRCNKDQEARARFKAALDGDPRFHHAKAQLALYDYKQSGNADKAISELQQAVTDARFQNVTALVGLALVQMERDSSAAGDRCKDDFDCAKLNLQRALAIDDGYMPAFNQLALYYFQSAKKRAASGTGKKGSKRQLATGASSAKRADSQQLELAALVCSQAVRKNPKYAPIHNTAGLIQNEQGLFNGAVSEFKLAAELDPRLFEAQMNYAAVNLSFRGFEQAEKAYRRALEMRPNDYDAHLGLALALRGQINDSNFDAQVKAVQASIDAAKKIDGARPDAYYNEGILVQEFRVKGATSDAERIKALNDAKGIFQAFLSKASGKSEYDAASKSARERVEDIDTTIEFIKAAPPAGSSSLQRPLDELMPGSLADANVRALQQTSAPVTLR